MPHCVNLLIVKSVSKPHLHVANLIRISSVFTLVLNRQIKAFIAHIIVCNPDSIHIWLESRLTSPDKVHLHLS